MKNLFKSFVVLLAVMAAVPSFAQKANNTLTEKEKKQGWTLLFNGKDFTGWRQCNSTGMAPNWVIEDEAMKVFTAPGKKPGHGAGGDILYKEKKFKNFELSVDWKTIKWEIQVSSIMYAKFRANRSIMQLPKCRFWIMWMQPTTSWQTTLPVLCMICSLPIRKR